MPRRKRSWLDGACYHITHRCHNRSFLFKYKKYRQFYLRHLYEMRKRYKIDVLDYIVTSNHVHLLLTAKKGQWISDGLRYLHGRVAQFFNIQTGKNGSFWSDRFHSTLIQSGKHFGECIFYIDLNMVRAKVVKHPSEWDACGFNEFYNPKERYRIINIDRLLQTLDINSINEFKQWHTSTIEEMIRNENSVKKNFWTQAYAVGDEEWITNTFEQAEFERMKIKKYDNIYYIIGSKS